jgi:hypothetical protein
MIVCDIVRAVLLAVLGILVLLHLVSWPVVLVVSLIEGDAGTIFDPAATPRCRGSCPTGSWSRRGPLPRAGRTVPAWPALGGVLFGLGRAVPFLADAVSYIVSFGTVSRIRGRFRPEKAVERKTLWREVAAHSVTAGGGASRHIADARTGRERRALRRDAPQRAGGNARPGHQYCSHGRHRPGGAAPLIAGLLVQHVSGAWAVGAFAATMAAAAALCLILPGLRKAETVAATAG